LSLSYTLTSRNGWYMSHVVSMRRPGCSRQAIISDLPKFILNLLATSFEHSTMVVRVKQMGHSLLFFKRIN